MWNRPHPQLSGKQNCHPWSGGGTCHLEKGNDLSRHWQFMATLGLEPGASEASLEVFPPGQAVALKTSKRKSMT